MTLTAPTPLRVCAPDDGLAIPTNPEIRAILPDHCFSTSLATSLAYAAMSVISTVGVGALAWSFVPLEWAWLPVWLVYAAVAGTLACGVWVIAHECGHGAFSSNDRVQNGIGFVLHSSLLVPYFSWQRSHAIHHAKTNHLTDGETHVPKRIDTPAGERALAARHRLGGRVHGTLTLFGRLVFGWPVYLLVGATGGVDRGVTNHFWPWAPFSSALFPRRWARRVLASALGVGAMLAILVSWAVLTSPALVIALYVGPYLVCNAWLVTYTWLQHTNHDVAHYDGDDWSFVRGAFCSVDRPYGRVVDVLHHRIGTTHVAHHLSSRIPHYHARAATAAIAEAYPELYHRDPMPVRSALWAASTQCVAVARSDDGWRYLAERP